METPAPAPFIVKSKKIKIISDKNNEYYFWLKIESYSLVFIFEPINEPDVSYKNSYTLNQLFSINKYFKICEIIEDAYQAILDNMSCNKYELKESSNCLTFTIITNDKFCGNYIFEIPFKTKPEKEEINDIYQQIRDLKSEYLKFKEENNNLKNEINKLKNEIVLIKETYDKNYESLKSSFDDLKNNFENMKKVGFPNLFKNPKNNCGESTVQFFQTDESYEGSDKSWAHYLVFNHGDGNSYYQVVVRFSFWGGPVLVGYRDKGVWKGWKRI